MNHKSLSFLPLVIFLALLAGVGYVMFLRGRPVVPTPTPTVEKTPTTEVADIISTATATSLPATSAPTSSPFPTPTTIPPTSTLTPSSTPVPPTLTPTPTNTHTPAPTATLIPTATPTPTFTPTPTDTPIPSPTSTPPPGAVVIAANGADLYFGPGTIYQKIGTLSNGEGLNVRGKFADDQWIKASSTTSSAAGWVQVDGSIQLKVDLSTIPTVEPPIPSTPLPPPILIAPENNATGFQNRAGLAWDWTGPFGHNDYYRVEIWNYYNDCCEFHRKDDNTFAENVEPIDVAWVQEKTYLYHKVKEALKEEYKWRITVVRYTGTDPLTEKDWARDDPKLQVWEPAPKDKFELVSWPSEMRILKVVPGNEPPPQKDKPNENPPGSGVG